jgi:hypothetical protein
MREFVIVAIHLPATLANLPRIGGVRAVAAESPFREDQLLITNRSRRRAPNLTGFVRVVLCLANLFLNAYILNARRLEKGGARIKPASLFQFHNALVTWFANGSTQASTEIDSWHPESRAWPDGLARRRPL